MKLYLFSALLVSFFISLPTLAEVEYYRIGPGHVLAYEYIPAKELQKTLILLPGINRALSTREASVKLLIEKGWGVILPTLQAQPLSIAGISANEEPAFIRNSELQAQDFSADILSLVQHLGVRNAIPVSLSYTSIVAAYLDPASFPHVIQTVPMINAAESNPEASQQAMMWEGWFRLNPFLAPYWIRSFRDNAYSLHWGQIVDSNLASDPDYYGSQPRVADIKQGYVTLARAAEEFDFSQWDFAADPRTHDFVLAGEENPVRLANQMSVIRNYLKSGKNIRVVVARKATHVIPSSEPTLYAGILDLLAKSPLTSSGSVQFVELTAFDELKNLQWQDRRALEKWLSKQGG